MKWMICLCLCMTLASSCDFKERERAIQIKEQELAAREQQLNDREQALQKAEGEFARKKYLDSTRADSLFLYENNLLGQWNTKMVCTQTTCAGSAIGDTKLENWTISYEDNRVVVRATVGDKLSRVYTGHAVNNALELEENIEPTTAESATKIAVRLKKQSDKLLEGQREILRTECKIVYSLQLTR